MRADLNGLTFNEAPRRAPAAELENVPRLARLGAVRREGETVRLGCTRAAGGIGRAAQCGGAGIGSAGGRGRASGDPPRTALVPCRYLCWPALVMIGQPAVAITSR